MAHILVVDDNLDSLEVLQDILGYHGLQVTGVANGEAALAKLATAPFDLVVIDLLLPGINGWELAQQINTQWSLPCVAITAYDNQRVSDEAMAAGFTAYFSKPIDALTFAQEIMAML